MRGRSRRVRHSASSLQAARNEAEAAFKNSSVYLEKYIDKPRAWRSRSSPIARAGNVVHCWDRDCSLQRRHQKLVRSLRFPLPLKTRARGLARPRSGSPRRWDTSTPEPASFWSEFERDKFYFIEVNTGQDRSIRSLNS